MGFFPIDKSECLQMPMREVCQQMYSYAEGIEVLYSTNTFILMDEPLILNISRFLLPQRLASIHYLEMTWKLRGSYSLEEGKLILDEAHLGDFLQVLSSQFPALRHLHIYLHGSAYFPNDEPLEPLQKCLDKFVQHKSDLDTCTFLIPTIWFWYFRINKLLVVDDG
jgi:hypothetical protein